MVESRKCEELKEFLIVCMEFENWLAFDANSYGQRNNGRFLLSTVIWGLSRPSKLLTDICAYLEDNLHSAEYENTSTITAALDFRCKKLLTYFDNIQGATDKQDSENLYIDMTGKTKYIFHPYDKPYPETSKNTRSGNDFIFISQSSRRLELSKDEINDYTIGTHQARRCRTLQERTSAISPCPYATLPADQFLKKNPLWHGQLLRIVRRRFLGQTKKYFSGVLGDWLLCYADETARKPSLSLYLVGAIIRHSGEEKLHQNCFEIYVVSKKCYVFQSNSKKNAESWVRLMCMTSRGHNCDQNDNIFDTGKCPREVCNSALVNSHTKNIRQLPNPPAPEASHFQKPTNKNDCDEIYEEPCPVISKQRIDDCNLIVSENVSDSAVDTRVTEPRQDIFESYDVPKTFLATLAGSSFIPLANHQSHEISQEKIQGKMKVSQEKFPAHLVIPIEVAVEKPVEPMCLNKGSEIQIAFDNSKPIEQDRSVTIQWQNHSTLVEKWLRKKFNKGNYSLKWNVGNLNRSPKDTLELQSSKRIQCHDKTCVGNRILVSSAKGEKVNMIVNQLVDSKGGVPIFRCNDTNAFFADSSLKESNSFT